MLHAIKENKRLTVVRIDTVMKLPSTQLESVGLSHTSDLAHHESEC
jgi:hypothetical protein